MSARCGAFAAFIGRSPDTATAEELRLFQLHQTQSGLQPPSINSAVSALRFLFTVTLDRPDLARRLTVVPYPRRIPTVLSVEEVTCCCTRHRRRSTRRPSPQGRRRTARLGSRCVKVGDIDSERMLLRVSAARGARTATRCCRRSFERCAPSGARGGGAACCCREAGCFPAGTRSSRCRPVSSAALSAPPPRPQESPSGCRRTRCGTASPPTCLSKASSPRDPDAARSC